MHRDPANILASHLDFTRVKAGAQRETDLLRSCAESKCATHRAARSVEGCENAVAHALHKVSPVLLDRQFGETIMMIEQLAPALISDFHRNTGRVDDVSEENGRQDPIRFGKSIIATSRNKFLNVADEHLPRSSKAGVGKIIVFNVFCAGDSRRELSTFSYRDDCVGATM